MWNGIGGNLNQGAEGQQIGQGKILKNFSQRGMASRTVKFVVTKKGTDKAVLATVKITGPAGRMALAEGDVWKRMPDGKVVPNEFRVPVGAVRWYELSIPNYGATIRERFSLTNDMEIPIEVE